MIASSTRAAKARQDFIDSKRRAGYSGAETL
jgi:hypothetical protein